MTKAYILTQPLNIEHVRNKGPMPSGYAHIRLRVSSDTARLQDAVAIVVSSDDVWQVRPDRYHSLSDYGVTAVEMLGKFAEEFVHGLREGAEHALSNALDKPVVGVTVTVEFAEFDMVYSTMKAFSWAAKQAITEALGHAKDSGLLEEIDI